MRKTTAQTIVNMSQRQAYLDREKLYQLAAEASHHHFKLATNKIGLYVSLAAVEAAITFPPAYLLNQFSKATKALIIKAENTIGKRPALKTAAVIEGTLFWTPDPTSEIVACTLVASSFAGYAFEKIVGKETADKLYQPFYKTFGTVAKQIPNPAKERTAVILKSLSDKVHNVIENLKGAHTKSPAMTVFQPKYF